MIIKIWDLLFTRRRWTVIQECALTNKGTRIGTRYVLQDQFGNLKQRDIW